MDWYTKEQNHAQEVVKTQCTNLKPKCTNLKPEPESTSTTTKSKHLDAMVEANISGNGIMQPPANGQKPNEPKDEGQVAL